MSCCNKEDTNGLRNILNVVKKIIIDSRFMYFFFLVLILFTHPLPSVARVPCSFVAKYASCPSGLRGEYIMDWEGNWPTVIQESSDWPLVVPMFLPITYKVKHNGPAFASLKENTTLSLSSSDKIWPMLSVYEYLGSRQRRLVKKMFWGQTRSQPCCIMEQGVGDSKKYWGSTGGIRDANITFVAAILKLAKREPRTAVTAMKAVVALVRIDTFSIVFWAQFYLILLQFSLKLFVA